MRQYLTLVILFVSLSCLGQIPETTKEAARAYTEKEYREAKMLSDKSIDGEGELDSYTWHVRGHICKELYKQEDNFDVDSEAREESILAFLKSMELDKGGEYAEWNRTSLKYLSSTFWNDAVNFLETQDPLTMHRAEESFDNYIKTVKKYAPETSLKEQHMDFYKAYATANRKIIEKARAANQDPDTYQEELKRIRTCYERAKEIDKDDYGTNYNYAINLYNEAAYRIERIPIDIDISMLILEQEGCIELFREARPFAERAYNQSPGRIEILKALRAIYLSLSEHELFDKYDMLIKQKQGEKMTSPSHSRDLEQLRKEGILNTD